MQLTPTADDIRHLETDHNRKYAPHLLVAGDPIRERIIIERAVIRRAVQDLIAAGYTLRVYYGEGDYGTERVTDVDTIMGAIGACDEEWINVLVRKSMEPGYSLVGQIALVYGNDGWDVIADNHSNLERVLAGATKLADDIADAQFGAAVDPYTLGEIATGVQ